MTLDYKQLKKEFNEMRKKELESWKSQKVAEQEELTQEEKDRRYKKQEHWEYLIGKLAK